VDLNAVAISNLDYVPGVAGAELAVSQSARDMKNAGMLSPRTDVDELARKSFVHFEGVTDEWLRGLQVERLADGRTLGASDIRLFADALQGADAPGNCCKRK
jgi:NitT/TauT family transport system substrate-binding protein